LSPAGDKCGQLCNRTVPCRRGMLCGRAAVRQNTDQPIAREDLERILEAGWRAPSSQNWQPTATEGPAAGFPRSAGPAR